MLDLEAVWLWSGVLAVMLAAPVSVANDSTPSSPAPPEERFAQADAAASQADATAPQADEAATVQPTAGPQADGLPGLSLGESPKSALEQLPEFEWEENEKPKRGFMSAFRLRGWQAELVARYERDDREVKSASGLRSEFDRTNFTERLRIRTRGFVFDPRLVSFRLGGSFGLSQEQFSSVGVSGDNSGELVSFDADAAFLQGKPISLNLFGTRTDDSVTQEFAGTKDVVVENLGALLTLSHPQLRSTLNLREQTIDEQLRVGDRDTRRAETRRIATYSGTRTGELSDLSLSYEYQEVIDEVAADLGFQAQDGFIGHRIFFGEYGEKDLRSRLRVFSRQGRFDNLSARIEEFLRIEHTDELETSYDYSYIFTDQDGSETTRQLAALGLRHQLYGSLRSSFRLSWNGTEFADGETVGYGGLGSLRYTKKIPNSGILSVGATESYRIDEQDFASGEVFVFQESQTVNEFEPVFLDNQFVFADTIFVTDISGTVIFEEGFDYRVTTIGDTTVLERLPGGRFEDNATILVDYQFASSRELSFSTFSHNYDVRLDYDWIIAFAEHRQTDQRLRSGDDDRFLDDITDQVVGLRLEWTRPKHTASASAEYARHDSERLEYTSPRFRQSWSYRPNPRLSTSVELNESFFDFTEPDRRTTNLLGRFDVKWRPRRYLDLDFFAGYLKLDDTVAVDETFIDTGIRANFEFGKLRITPSFIATNRVVGDGETTSFRTRITIVRELP